MNMETHSTATVERPEKRDDVTTNASESEIDGMVSEIREFLETSRTSQTELARKAGLSAAVLSQILKGSYTGDTASATRRFHDVVTTEKNKLSQMLQAPGFVETGVYAVIRNVLDIAQFDANMTVMTGAAGIGKTASLEHYREQHASTIFIQVDPTYRLKTLLLDIAGALQLDTKGTPDVLFKKIEEKLRGTDRMIIVDEADYLNVKAMDVLRRIHDKAGVPVVLVGLPRLLTMIAGIREKYEQIFSRMNYVGLSGLSRDDTRLILEQVMSPTAELTAKFHDASKGNARRLVKLLNVAQRTALRNNLKQITPAVVKKALEALI